MKKRILSVVLALIISMSGFSVVFASEISWPQKKALDMPFAPENNYVSGQNSPCFTWPKAGDAYDLVISSDSSLENILHKVESLKDNFYTFPYELETEKELYWAVRFKSKGQTSVWSDARRLVISKDAVTFLLPDIDELMFRIPQSHPRLLANEDNLAQRRLYKDKSTGAAEIYAHFKAKADEYVAKGEIPPEPVYKEGDNYVDTGIAMQTLRKDAAKILDIIYTCGFVYLISGEKEIGNFAKKALVSVSGWDPKGDTSFAMQDQVCREITYKSAFGYDWVYDLLSESEKTKVENMLTARLQQMDHYADELYSSPYDSHGWTTVGYVGITCVALYKEIPEAEELLRKILLMYANILPPWSYEDGGWSQGTYYWSGNSLGKETLDTFNLSGIYNLYDKVWQKNETKNFLYSTPHGSVGSWGDSSNLTEMAPADAYQTFQIAANSNDPYAKWFAEETSKPYSIINYFYMPDYEKVESKYPYDLPLSNYFKDIGWVAMHSDLVDENRISMFFKSSPYGSYNHSEADQNSFIIQAFGENLAIKSGYYDSYHSRHNSGFARKTYAHNSVTVNGGKGQVDDSMDSKGKITSYINSSEFDMCTGDASAAYSSTRMDKFLRTVIYIRPDQFIVIDDLKAGEGSNANFEWWLNASDKISLYSDGSGAKIEKGNAVLDAKLHYPSGCTPYYTDLFSGPTLEHIAAQGSYQAYKVHKRIWFETPRVNQTKMIVTMDAHQKDSSPKYIKNEAFENYMKLTFEDGTVALINLKDNRTFVETNMGINFIGEAVVFNDEEIMLVNGTNLSVNGKTLIESKNESSVALNKNELSISTAEDNTISVNVNNEYNSNPSSITESFESSATLSIKEEKDNLIINALKGEYKLEALSEKAGTKAGIAEISVVTDGKKNKYRLDGYYLKNGNISVSGKIKIPSGKYIVKEKSKELSFGGVYQGEVKSLENVYVSTNRLDNNKIVLESVPAITVNSEQLTDVEGLKTEMEVFMEAEGYDSLTEGGIYTTRAFLSGGAGVSNFNGTGNLAAYTLNVPEAGYYDMYIKYVSWEAGGESRRGINIGGKYFITEMPYTVSWGSDPSEWRVMKIPTNIYLEKGENSISIESISGMANFDWLGLKKSN